MLPAEILRTSCSGSLVVMEDSAFELTLESRTVKEALEKLHEMVRKLVSRPVRRSKPSLPSANLG